MNKAQKLIREMAHHAINMLYVCDPDSAEWHYAIHALGEYSDWYELQTDLPEDFHVNFNANTSDNAPDCVDADTAPPAEEAEGSGVLRPPFLIWNRTSLRKPEHKERVLVHSIDYNGRDIINCLMWDGERGCFFLPLDREGEMRWDAGYYKFWARINLPGDV